MKHDHKKTKKLKVALFSMIMFLPFIAIGITCATHIFNKEVAEQTQTATINYMYDTNNPQEELIQNNIYKINTNGNYQDLIGDLEENIFDLEIISGSITWQYATMSTADNYPYEENEFNKATALIQIYENAIWLTYTNKMGYIQYEFNTETNTKFQINAIVILKNTTAITDTSSILLSKLQQCPQNEIPIQNVDIITNTQDETTNIFYDSCDQVQDSFILNWCTNGNPIRNGINAFTNAFNLPNEHMINTLLTYWLCISMIYIVIDIIIECIVYITHFFNKEV